MEAPGFTSSYGLAVLLDDIKVEPPDVLLRRLYGPLYESSISVRPGEHGPRATARRHPKPLDAARFLEPIVSGEIAHDGSRRNRHTRTSGWWRQSGDGWSPTSLTSILVELAPATELLLDAAISRDRAERGMRFVASPADRDSRHRATAMQTAAVDSLHALVSSGATRFAETAAVWRDDPSFALPTADHDAALLAWLAETAAANGWAAGQRIPALDVWDAYRKTGGPFLQFDLLRRLDDALGPEGARTRRGFRIPTNEGILE